VSNESTPLPGYLLEEIAKLPGMPASIR